MKTIRILFTILCVSLASGVFAQEPEGRDFSVKITNRRGKPVSGIVVQTVNSGEVGITDRQGRYAFRSLAGEEQIRMFLPNHGETIVPIAGLDSLDVMIRSGEVNYYNAKNHEQIDIGYGSVSRSANTSSSGQLDVEKLVAEGGVTDLISLLQGRIAGLDIRPDGSALIRGASSIMGSNEPLVLLDGSDVGTLAAANSMVNIHDVKSVSVLKEGAIYGSRGGNGVILITTKRAK